MFLYFLVLIGESVLVDSAWPRSSLRWMGETLIDCVFVMFIIGVIQDFVQYVESAVPRAPIDFFFFFPFLSVCRRLRSCRLGVAKFSAGVDGIHLVTEPPSSRCEVQHITSCSIL